ncbi:MAG: biopolymer transporter ExbD [Flavobacteriales bacterium]|jgi:biopolymer transport protein ExbD|nr:biopolymer transporter ExbD [Flavobacteriales bacterium]
MSKFKKDGGKPAPGINTSSLPDIVFMLLFFFMVATTSKETDPTVKVVKPTGVEAADMTPYKQRSEIDFLYLGKPLNAARAARYRSIGMEYMLFMDNVVQSTPDDLYSTNAIRNWKSDKFEAKKSKITKGIESVITCVKADEGAPTGTIFDIRKELQKIDALSIAYAVDGEIKK